MTGNSDAYKWHHTGCNKVNNIDINNEPFHLRKERKGGQDTDNVVDVVLTNIRVVYLHNWYCFKEGSRMI